MNATEPLQVKRTVVRVKVRVTPEWVKLQPGEKTSLVRRVKVSGRWGLVAPGTMVLTQQRLFLQKRGLFPARVQVIPREQLVDVRPNEAREGWLTIRYAAGPETRTIQVAPLLRDSVPPGTPATPAARAMELAEAIHGLQRGDLKAMTAESVAPLAEAAARKAVAARTRARKPPSVAGLAAEAVIAVGLVDQGISAMRHGGSFAQLIPGLAILVIIGYHAYRIYRARMKKEAASAESKSAVGPS